jgi:glutamate-ammonia-ligase adenylyltransferase
MKIDDFNLEPVPALLQEPVLRWFERNLEKPPLEQSLSVDDRLKSELPRVIACSNYVAERLESDPALLLELVTSGRLRRPAGEGEYRQLHRDCLDLEMAESDFQQQIRRLRHRELMRIVWRDLAGDASLEQTLADLSGLADAAIGAALAWGRNVATARYGSPGDDAGAPVEFAVLAMGKLGGGELNFSSDVDVIFVYSDRGQTDGKKSIENEEYFRFVAQQIVNILSKKTADGFVYRVDTRLRPFGDSGPLAVSVPALENYLTQHGRDWERYAYVKARVVNDWSGADDFFRSVLRPFIYRRYLDFGVFSSLRDMKAMIDAEVQRSEFHANIKLGRGGIREIEFIVQSLQLVRGGTVEELQDRRLLSALEKLSRPGGLPEEVVVELRDAYCFLRLFENRLQAIDDRQTHDVPGNELDRERLALAMGYAQWQPLEDLLSEHRRSVNRHFQNIVFRGVDEPELTSPDSELIRAWATGDGSTDIGEVLSRLGYADADTASSRLSAFRDSNFFRQLDEAGRTRLNMLMPEVVRIAGEQAEPLDALLGTFAVIESIGRRSAYFALLNENPEALRRLVNLCAMSGLLIRQISTHPLLLDELLDHRVFLEPPSRDDLQADLDSRLAAAPTDDPEARLNAIRNFQQAGTFRVAVADLSGAMTLMHVSDRLTDIAELVLVAALDLAWSEITRRYGRPQCYCGDELRDVQFAIVAYGKLGGVELGYGSDLDLIFLHDSAGERQITDGEKSIDNTTFLVRLTGRIIHILTMSTSSGALYEVDTRLRPNGQSGLLVSSLASLDRYQCEDAWTWEHQALLRGRAVAGNADIRAGFDALRRRVLTRHVRWESLEADVQEMRQRMRRELGKGTAESFDIKQDAGGVTDIEFIVQYLVLKEARHTPDLIFFSDNIRQLDSLTREGVLAEQDAKILADAYRFYRQKMHHLSLAGRERLAPRVEMAGYADQVTAIWKRIFPGPVSH